MSEIYCHPMPEPRFLQLSACQCVLLWLLRSVLWIRKRQFVYGKSTDMINRSNLIKYGNFEHNIQSCNDPSGLQFTIFMLIAVFRKRSQLFHFLQLQLVILLIVTTLVWIASDHHVKVCDFNVKPIIFFTLNAKRVIIGRMLCDSWTNIGDITTTVW